MAQTKNAITFFKNYTDMKEIVSSEFEQEVL